MKTLLIVSDSPYLASGQARVVRELARRFHASGVRTVVAGWFNHVILTNPPPEPYPVLNAYKTEPEQLRTVLDLVMPDTVLAIGDPKDFVWLAQQRSAGARWRLAGHLNIETGPIQAHIEPVLDAFDVLATTSIFGARTVGRPEVTPIQYGVDPAVFHPMLPVDQIAGRSTDSTFIVLFNGQNIQRKNPAAALRGFAEFARGKSDVLFYANTQLRPTAGGGQDLAAIITEAEIEDLVVFEANNKGPLSTISDEAVNALYNLATVLLITSASEGFCLPVIEAMATGCLPVAPAAYSMPELIGERARGFLYPVAAVWNGEGAGDMAIVHPRDVAGALEQAYEAWKYDQLVDQLTAAGQFAASLTWNRTYEQLRDLLDTDRSGLPPRAANGRSIDPVLRARARRIPSRSLGILKYGGLGDMLQATCVVRAAAAAYDQPVVVFCNNYPEVFERLPEVKDVVHITARQEQSQALRSVADHFDLFMDLRYVSWLYGAEPDPYAVKHRWFYEQRDALRRIASLREHTTRIMLRSLGLPADGDDAIRPSVVGGDEPIVTLGGAQCTIGVWGDQSIERASYVVVASGLETSLKSWGADRWAAFSAMAAEAEIPLLQVGLKGDLEIPGALDYRGLSLLDTTRLLRHAVVACMVEGGMAHLAAGVGLKTVVLFGPTPIVSFGYPWNINLGQHDCEPCFWSMPTWRLNQCAIGAPRCVNFFDPHVVFDPVLQQVLGRR